MLSPAVLRRRRGSPLSGGGGGGGGAALYSMFDVDDLPNVTPVLGGGMILRNSAYTGPALRVADASSTDEVDVSFAANGSVYGARPYGSSTRLVRVYDQWGTDDFIATEAAGIQLVEDDAGSGLYTWQINFNPANTGLFTASTANDNPPWEQTDPLWAIGVTRVSSSGLLSIHGVDHGSFMTVGLWQEAADLHWRIEGQGGTDWTGTDWTGNAPASQVFSRAIGDMTQRNSTGYAYFNGNSAGTRGYSGDINSYAGGSTYGWGDKDGLGSPFDGRSTELHIFSSSAAATVPEIAYLDTAIAEFGTVNPNV